MQPPSRKEQPKLYLLRPAEHASVPADTGSTAPDPLILKAVELMRASLHQRWTVTALARRAGMSRPALARRFVQSTGCSPLRYLALCRMERAAELLRESQLTLAEIALRVGYTSEFAFNRAFKRHYHVAPGGFRRRVQSGTGPVFRMAA